MPIVGAALGGDDHGASSRASGVGVLLGGLHGEFLDGVGREILQKAANPVVGIVHAVHESALLRPELPPVETAVMRALVGSEGSTGSVPGARYAMLAKLRALSGKVSRSSDVTCGLVHGAGQINGLRGDRRQPETRPVLISCDPAGFIVMV